MSSPLPIEQTSEPGETEAAIWRGTLEPAGSALSPEAARFLLALESPPEDKARMRELAAKARAGTLNPAEREQAESYGRVGSLLGVLKSKARVSLRAASRPG